MQDTGWCVFKTSLVGAFSFIEALCIHAAIPNLYAIQTLDSAKKATSLQKGLPENRTEPLNVFIQVNTSGEDTKSGLPPLSLSQENLHETEIVALAIHVLENCPLLRLRGLMTIGSIEQSHAEDNEPNRDFETLVNTANMVESILSDRVAEVGKWGGPDGRLELSMGMSADFESAIQAGAGAVRVGSGIFGARKTKEEIKQ
jgi:pyridoxal phosphate enzyme (YggS family)